MSRMTQHSNQWLMDCWGIGDGKWGISGQNEPAQESMTYELSRHQRGQTDNQWMEWPRKRNQWLMDCQGIGDGKRGISGQNELAQESMTYVLSRHRRGQMGDQWTEWASTGINDLRTVEASERANGQSVDRVTQDRNWWIYPLSTSQFASISHISQYSKYIPCTEDVSIIFPTLHTNTFTTKCGYHPTISSWNTVGIIVIICSTFVIAGVKFLSNHVLSHRMRKNHIRITSSLPTSCIIPGCFAA